MLFTAAFRAICARRIAVLIAIQDKGHRLAVRPVDETVLRAAQTQPAIASSYALESSSHSSSALPSRAMISARSFTFAAALAGNFS